MRLERICLSQNCGRIKLGHFSAGECVGYLMPYSRIPRAPVISISSMGLSLNLRKATKLATKTIPAAISKCACVSCDRVLTEVNANNSIVAAAERINPAEAALSRQEHFARTQIVYVYEKINTDQY